MKLLACNYTWIRKVLKHMVQNLVDTCIFFFNSYCIVKLWCVILYKIKSQFNQIVCTFMHTKQQILMSIGCTCTYLYSGTAIKEDKTVSKTRPTMDRSSSTLRKTIKIGLSWCLQQIVSGIQIHFLLLYFYISIRILFYA